MKLFSKFRKLLGASAAFRQKYRRSLHLFLVSLLNVAIAIPVTASTVAPAPPATIFILPATFHMNLSVWNMLCAGYNYDVKVSVRTDYQRPVGGITIQFSDVIVPGIVINSSSSSPSVATLSPTRLVSGVLGGGNGLGEVTFTLHALKAGSTTIQFYGTVPGQLTQGDPLGVGAAQAVQVQYCAYRISENGSWSIAYPNLRTTLTDSLRGQIITGETSGLLTGTGDVTWSLRSFSVMCSHSHSLTLDHAQLQGQANEDQLLVRIEFGPVGFSTVNCGSSNEGEFQPPVIYRGGPSTGFTGGNSVPVQVGNFMMTGHYTMSVTPVILH
jgi:hypothetical protein